MIIRITTVAAQTVSKHYLKNNNNKGFLPSNRMALHDSDISTQPAHTSLGEFRHTSTCVPIQGWLIVRVRGKIKQFLCALRVSCLALSWSRHDKSIRQNLSYTNHAFVHRFPCNALNRQQQCHFRFYNQVNLCQTLIFLMIIFFFVFPMFLSVCFQEKNYWEIKYTFPIN